MENEKYVAGGISGAARANRYAAAALDRVQDALDVNSSGEEFETAASDLLADLMLACHVKGIEFWGLMGIAERHCAAEIMGAM